MILQVNNAALQTLASKLKLGGTFKCDKENDLFTFVLLDADRKKHQDYICKSTSFKYGFKELVAKQTTKTGENSAIFELDDRIEAVLNNNFSLRIGSKLMQLENKIQPKQEMKIFDGYYFNISNGVISTDLTSKNFVEGFQTIARQAGSRFAEPEA